MVSVLCRVTIERVYIYVVRYRTDDVDPLPKFRLYTAVLYLLDVYELFFASVLLPGCQYGVL